MRRDVIGSFTFTDVISEENSSGNSLTQKKKTAVFIFTFKDCMEIWAFMISLWCLLEESWGAQYLGWEEGLWLPCFNHNNHDYSLVGKGYLRKKKKSTSKGY